MQTNQPSFDRDRKKVKPLSNSLLLHSPEIASEWHPTRNGILRPAYVSFGSNNEAWWLCPEGHAYPAKINTRTSQKTGCPYCNGKAVLPGFNDLLTVCPEIAAEWHPTLNGDLTPSTVSKGCTKKVTWLCPEGHAYPASINSRTNQDSGCPYCSGKMVLPGFNDLLTVRPEIAAEWHPSLNGDLTPSKVTKGSSKKVMWLCPFGHTYPATITHRTLNNSGCPYCNRKAVLPGFNDLSTVCPEIAAEWHPSLNGDLTPSKVTRGSSKKVMWLCPLGHAYPATIKNRVSNHTGCPYCNGDRALPGFNDLSTVCPEIVAEWHPFLNGDLTPSNVTRGCKDKVMWLCPKGHTYSASIKNRVLCNSGCPYCGGDKAIPGFNDLSTVCPEIAAEWHPSLNGELSPMNVTKGCDKKVMWLCPNGHAYPAKIRERTSHNTGCPYCHGKAVLPGFNDLLTVCPEIAAEWHPSLNGELTPSMVTKCCAKEVMWLCPKGHSYPAKICIRTSCKSGCPYCSGYKTALEDSFAHLYPELLPEWNYLCNYAICSPDEIKPESNKSVFWICTKDPTHTFPMSIKDRVTYYNRHKEACPSCKGLRRKKNHFI